MGEELLIGTVHIDINEYLELCSYRDTLEELGVLGFIDEEAYVTHILKTKYDGLEDETV